MLSTFNSNLVRFKIELCKYLWRDQVVVSDINEIVAIKLLYYVVMLDQDVEHLQVQWSYPKGRVV